MESWISDLAAYGYSILFAAVFLEAVGFRVPAALALLIAGGASARGSFSFCGWIWPVRRSTSSRTWLLGLCLAARSKPLREVTGHSAGGSGCLG
jgi:hypothetical protein